MAQILRGFSSITDITSGGDMQRLVNNYWGSADQERIFVIPFWKLKQLFDASTIEEVAFKVTDINNPFLVYGEWIVFEELIEEGISRETQRPNDYYFVMEESLFEDIKTGAANEKPTYLSVLWGRLGKDTINNEVKYFVFFNAASLDLIGDGGGGDGTISGVRIPPGQ